MFKLNHKPIKMLKSSDIINVQSIDNGGYGCWICGESNDTLWLPIMNNAEVEYYCTMYRFLKDNEIFIYDANIFFMNDTYSCVKRALYNDFIKTSFIDLTNVDSNLVTKNTILSNPMFDCMYKTEFDEKYNRNILMIVFNKSTSIDQLKLLIAEYFNTKHICFDNIYFICESGLIKTIKFFWCIGVFMFELFSEYNIKYAVNTKNSNIDSSFNLFCLELQKSAVKTI